MKFRHKPYNALVVDWDYFFHIDPAWEWAHSEKFQPEFLSGLWMIRAAQFIAEGKSLPGLESDLLDGFWQRFRYRFGSKLYIADSNKHAYLAVQNELGDRLDDTGVWLFDQHHDCGYLGAASQDDLDKNGLSCENWMLALTSRIKFKDLHVRYPEHSNSFDWEPEPAAPIDREVDHPRLSLPQYFDVVFVCRSGAWVPPWHDEAFFNFVRTCPVSTLTVPLEVLTPRPFEMPVPVPLAELEQLEACQAQDR